MAESSELQEEKSLREMFLEGWKNVDELENSQLSSNCAEFQGKVKETMHIFEKVTSLVSEIGMFSSNEMIDEVATECLQYLLLPLFMGKLTLQINKADRMEVLNLAEIYFKDFLQRCQDYELCDSSKELQASNAAQSGNELSDLIQAGRQRNNKIAQYRRQKELQEYIKKMQEAIQRENVDDDIKREFFIKYLKKGIIEATQELDTLQIEKQIVEMRKARMSAGDDGGQTQPPNRMLPTNMDYDNHTPESHQCHGHSHSHHQQLQPSAGTKPLRAYIITKNAMQKAVFGQGYPSLPVMSVDEFYEQRVRDGVFPDEEKMAAVNKAKALAAQQDPEELEEQEKAEEERQIEEDDPEYLQRMRNRDEYKDVVRRGDGNRYNRS